jgi:ribosomal protein L14E/L6E/L27E
MKKIQPGQIVKILYGREAGNHAVVIDIEQPSFVWVADGKSRPLNKPKKKNVKHIQRTHAVGIKVVNALRQGVLTNAHIRSDLNQYLRQKDVGE